VRLVKDYVEAKESLPGDKVLRTRLAVDLLEELWTDYPDIAKNCEAESENMCRLYMSLVEPARPEAVLTLVVILARHGKVDEALDGCEKALRAGCNREDFSSAVLVAVQDPATTKKQLQRAERLLAVMPADRRASASIRLSQAGLCEAKGHHDPEYYSEAERHYGEVLLAEADNVLARNNLAFLLAFHAGRPPEALEHINHAIDVMGPAAELLDTRALVHMAAGKAEKAIDDLEAARSQRLRSASTWYHLSEAYALAGRREDAMNAFAKAKTLGLKARDLHHLEKGRYEEALRTLSAD
jgi:tetratricopeptide (TPR) repeat protein